MLGFILGQWRTGPPTEPSFSQGFFLHSVTDGVLVLATVAFGLLTLGDLISSNIVGLIAQILFEEN